MTEIDIVVAYEDELTAAQRFYESRRYGGAAIAQSDFVTLAKWQEEIVGVGRLCQEGELLWLRGMQVAPQFQRQGIGAKILQRLVQEIGGRWCCCLPYEHLVGFFRLRGFERTIENLPLAVCARLEGYRSRGLKVVAMVRSIQTRSNISFEADGYADA